MKVSATIELEFKCSNIDDVDRALDAVLDNAALQDALNEWALDEDIDLVVTQAAHKQTDELEDEDGEADDGE